MKFKLFIIRIIGIVGILVYLFTIFNLTLDIEKIIYFSYSPKFLLPRMILPLYIGIILLFIHDLMVNKYNKLIMDKNEYNALLPVKPLIGIASILLWVFAIYNITFGIVEMLDMLNLEFVVALTILPIVTGIILRFMRSSMVKKYNQQLQQAKDHAFQQNSKKMWDEDKNKCYNLLLNNPHISMDALAANIDDRFHSTQENYTWVTLIVKALLKEGMFPGAYLDPNTNSLAFPEKPANTPENMEYQTIICNKCGASNKINTGSICECEYCGNPLK